MTYFLFQWKYKDEAINAMVTTPQDRAAELRKAVQGFDGRMHQFFYAFGEYDGLSIVEFPSNEKCAACSSTLNGAGANATFRTTVLLTGEEIKAAMKEAKTVHSGYSSPVGYSSFG